MLRDYLKLLAILKLDDSRSENGVYEPKLFPCSPDLGTPLARVTYHRGRGSSGSDSGIFLLTMHHALFG
jgi:hypothetical protein